MQKRGMAAILLTLVLLAALLPRALAAGRVDLNRELQLHLSYQKDGAALAGAQASIYRVAEMEETGALTATKEFGAFSVDIRGKNDEKWRELAATMEAAVLPAEPMWTESSCFRKKADRSSCRGCISCGQIGFSRAAIGTIARRSS